MSNRDLISELRGIVNDATQTSATTGQVVSVGFNAVTITAGGVRFNNVPLIGGTPDVGDIVRLLWSGTDPIALSARPGVSGAAADTLSSNLSLSNFYTKAQINTLLQMKADKDAPFTPSNITARTGNIGDWMIEGGYIYLDADTDAESAGMHPADFPFWAGALRDNRATAPFRVTNAGALYSTSGEIAGWEINEDYLAKDTGVNATSAGMRPADWPFWAGATHANRATAPFRVAPDGTLYASGASISGDIIAGDDLQSDNYVPHTSGWRVTGDGDAEFNSVEIRGEMRAAMFSYGEVHAAGGSLLILPSGILLDETHTGGTILLTEAGDPLLTEDGAYLVADGTALLDIKDPPSGHLAIAAVDDILRIKAFNGTSVVDNWVKVTAVTDMTTYYRYTVSLQSGTAALFPEGITVVNYRQSSNGGILLQSDHSTYKPFISIFENGSTPWTSVSERVRLGDLNGTFGVGSEAIGLGVGDYSTGNYMLYNPDAADAFALYFSHERLILNSEGLLLDSPSQAIAFDYDGTRYGQLMGYLGDDTKVLSLRRGIFGGNLIANPSFETNESNWTFSGSDFTHNRSSTYAVDGSYSEFLETFDRGSSNKVTAISNSAAATAGTVYTLSMDSYLRYQPGPVGPSGTGTTRCRLIIVFEDSGHVDLSNSKVDFPFSGSSTRSRWNTSLVTATAPVGTAYVRAEIELYVNETGGVNYLYVSTYIDNVVLTSDVTYSSVVLDDNGVVINGLQTLDNNGNVYSVLGGTTMADGFMYVPSAAGAPSGTPNITSRVPLYYDTTNNHLYAYNGAWKKVLLS